MPAAAVIQGMQALFRFTGRKEFVDVLVKSFVKSKSLTSEMHRKLIRREGARGKKNSQCRSEIFRYWEELLRRKCFTCVLLTLNERKLGK